jgi:hypothetical protein
MSDHPETPAPPPEVAFKCRRPGCTGVTATVLSKPGDLSKIYCCTTCKHTQVVATGGFFPV